MIDSGIVESAGSTAAAFAPVTGVPAVVHALPRLGHTGHEPSSRLRGHASVATRSSSLVAATGSAAGWPSGRHPRPRWPRPERGHGQSGRGDVAGGAAATRAVVAPLGWWQRRPDGAEERWSHHSTRARCTSGGLRPPAPRRPDPARRGKGSRGRPTAAVDQDVDPGRNVMGTLLQPAQTGPRPWRPGMPSRRLRRDHHRRESGGCAPTYRAGPRPVGWLAEFPHQLACELRAVQGVSMVGRSGKNCGPNG
jgi:hypothetical protein